VITIQHWLGLSAMVFTLGLCGVLMRRNVILVMMSIEIMLNAANLALVAFNKYLLPAADGTVAPDGQVLVFFTIAVAAAEVAVALVIAMLLFRRLDTVSVDDVANLRW
jgi:NADH:ubiquinone oxidoreductase subunit K